MSVISGANAVAGAGGAAGYQIERSLRFNSADSAYLSRTPASAGNQQKWTWSGWIKIADPAQWGGIFNAGSSGNQFAMYLYSDSTLYVQDYTGSNNILKQTTQVFRDVSAWYHIVLRIDTTLGTASNRVRLYVNGVQVTSFASSTNPSQNYNTQVNSTSYAHNIGRNFQFGTSTAKYFSGYMAEVHFVDGSSLAPTDFGEYNEDTGVWQPIAYAGSYGTNGFYLNFSDNSGTTSTTLGKDYSGNSNNWTPNNFSVTAGAGNDSLVDTPTPYGTDTGAGGEVRGNYCTMNPLDKYNSSGTTGTLANGNLDVSGFGDAGVGATMAVSSGKWYWEFTIGSSGGSGQYISAGIAKSSVIDYYDGVGSNGYTYDAYGYYGTNGYKASLNASVSYGATFTDGDVIGVALDLDSGTLTFYKNGSSQGTAFTGLSGEFKPFYFTRGTTSSAVFNFGQRPFAYTAPSGFAALCTQNLPDPTVKDGSQYMDALLWTGDGSQTRSLTGLAFQPDFTWMKSRSVVQEHQLYDVVRGAGGGKMLCSNLTAQEGQDGSGNSDSQYGYVSSFDSGGFSVDDGSVATTGGWVNYSGRTYVAWNWKAGGAGVSNTDGTITSTVSANTTAGFSVVTWTGAGSAGTIGHGLGVTPSMIIVKNRSATQYWFVNHTSISATQNLYLNTVDSVQSDGIFTSRGAATFGVGTGVAASSTNYVAYCSAPVEGYSAFGSYTGNGSADGPFVYTGFRPRWIMIKAASGSFDTSAWQWVIYDSERDPYNLTSHQLRANQSNAENDDTLYNKIDIVSNGFKNRAGNYGELNGSGNTYIYMAFAENPFKYSLAR